MISDSCTNEVMNTQLIDSFFNYCYKDDLKSERFLSMSKEEQTETVNRAKARCTQDVERLTKQIEEKDVKLFITGAFHPSNRFYRHVFTTLTGIELPGSPTDTRAMIATFVGQDKIDAHYKAIECAKAEEKRKEEEKEAARINTLKDLIKEDREISGGDLVDVARSMYIEVHPRTAGMLFKRVKGICSTQGRIVGKSTGNSPYDLYKQVRSLINGNSPS
jgi:SepF-like predicted cell division protein (DUF552 family)